MARTESWKKVREQRTLNEQHVQAYERLLEVEARLPGMGEASNRDSAGGTDLPLPEVSSTEPQQDVCLSTLMRYVAVLGGHVELRTVLPDETVTLLGAPEGS